MMTARVPPWQRVISVLSSPKGSSTVAHCWAGRATPLTALSCPSNWLRSSLQLSLDAELTDVPSQPPLLLQIVDIKRCFTHWVTAPAPPGTNRDNHSSSLCLLGNLHQQIPSKGGIWQLRAQQSQTPPPPLP